jgi:hypothetical protein
MNIPERDIETLKTLAMVCRRFGSYLTIDRIQRQIYEIEIQTQKITSAGVPIPA